MICNEEPKHYLKLEARHNYLRVMTKKKSGTSLVYVNALLSVAIILTVKVNMKINYLLFLLKRLFITE